MKRLVLFIITMALSIMVTAPFPVYAEAGKAKSEVVMKVGSKVHLFHSGKTSAQKDIAIGDVIPVFRQLGKTQQEKEVGKVKVLSFVGDHYFEAEIVSGDVKVSDVAKKKTTSMLVQPIH